MTSSSEWCGPELRSFINPAKQVKSGTQVLPLALSPPRLLFFVMMSDQRSTPTPDARSKWIV